MPIPDMTGLWPFDLPVYELRTHGDSTGIALHAALMPYPERLPQIAPRWKPGECATLNLPTGYIPGVKALEDAWGYATPRGIGMAIYADHELLPFEVRLAFFRATQIFVDGLAQGCMSWFEWERSGGFG